METKILWIFSNLGDAALLLPLALVCALWLRSVDMRLAIRWAVLLTAGMGLVGLSKILYAGCGLEVPAIEFRMISGHTMLAASIYTVAAGLLAGGLGRAWYLLGAAAGLVLAALIGASRILQDAHTPAEVVAGWLLGGLIAFLLLRHVFAVPRKMPRALVAGLGLLAVSSIAYGHHAPFQRMIEHYSWWLCRGLGLS
ncbi:phosphatase PAP2 family protein [Caballeronia sp. LP006]|jgi:membrane-associated phospholipid phosphatase|uniref:phosphatase PAP2 family protein n=1 Tax=unclassified Caballeronia TaxID=2646786 RepID=UPI001FD3566C|nr:MULTISPECIES: phosphatase PAP2 family protein [unclassified Caballeronia]MDR5772355.1 phosphatase PAP2 family protein [Caballeronia sp. LZ002]MDR5804214.1 phosphatase PAP2 family protein [Caballeronia sp. LZ001]MDR5831942.1 phosphatase PAP2 family protein [Caballeronia sp. LP006]MDR5847789.1 phosphatase PAP2 family protein [Caballeronia sp. LZ003]